MPELPEVETVCRGLHTKILNKRFVDVRVYTRKIRVSVPSDLGQRLRGQRIIDVQRRAKYILICLENGQALVIHLGMTGTVRILDSAAVYTKEKHDHVVFKFDDGHAMVFHDPRRFGMVFHVYLQDMDTHKAFAHLGPEPLDTGFTPGYLLQALRNRKTAIKLAIMDQKIVVGVGNIYASEALFKAGIHPERPANSLKKEEISVLIKAIRAVLRAAIRSGGSTLRDYRQADGAMGYFQHHFDVYEKAGEACRECTCSVAMTGGIRKITQGGRSTYYCLVLQK